jgi:pimeloyl-ACP methyl ester carboxylesterase
MAKLHHRVDGSGPMVVLLHAGVADLRMWDAQTDALVAERCVLRCDLRGFGQTVLRPGSDYCDAEDVLELLDELDVERYDLVGASYGGSVALQVASAAPERLQRLVLLDAAADLVEPDDALRRFWQQERDLLEAGDLEGATELNVRTWLGPDADQHARELTGRMQRRAFELQRAAGEVNDRELEVDLTRISAPTTVVVGGHDLPFFRATADALASGLPHSELVDLPWAGHLPSLERPQKTAELVRDHLRRA